jgi:hypothetical protein
MVRFGRAVFAPRRAGVLRPFRRQPFFCNQRLHSRDALRAQAAQWAAGAGVEIVLPAPADAHRTALCYLPADFFRLPGDRKRPRGRIAAESAGQPHLFARPDLRPAQPGERGHLFRLRNRIVRRLLLLAAVALGGWLSQHVVYPSGSARLALSLANFFAYFLAGFLLADLYLGGWLRAEKRLAFDLLALLAAAAIVLVLTTHGHFYFSLPLLILPLYIGCFRGRASNAFLRARWIAITGGMCYTLYLYHAPILSEFSWNINSLFSVARPIGLDYLTQLLIVCPAIFALCSLWFVLTEKPFMKWSLSATPDRIRATTFVAPSSQND